MKASRKFGIVDSKPDWPVSIGLCTMQSADRELSLWVPHEAMAISRAEAETKSVATSWVAGEAEAALAERLGLLLQLRQAFAAWAKSFEY
jgi:hypothetical protein